LYCWCLVLLAEGVWLLLLLLLLLLGLTATFQVSNTIKDRQAVSLPECKMFLMLLLLLVLLAVVAVRMEAGRPALTHPGTDRSHRPKRLRLEGNNGLMTLHTEPECGSLLGSHQCAQQKCESSKKSEWVPGHCQQARKRWMTEMPLRRDPSEQHQLRK
jgi:hypothetical protein